MRKLIQIGLALLALAGFQFFSNVFWPEKDLERAQAVPVMEFVQPDITDNLLKVSGEFLSEVSGLPVYVFRTGVFKDKLGEPSLSVKSLSRDFNRKEVVLWLLLSTDKKAVTILGMAEGKTAKKFVASHSYKHVSMPEITGKDLLGIFGDTPYQQYHDYTSFGQVSVPLQFVDLDKSVTYQQVALYLFMGQLQGEGQKWTTEKHSVDMRMKAVFRLKDLEAKRFPQLPRPIRQ